MARYKKGDEFVIEIGDVFEVDITQDNITQPYVLYRIKGFNSLVFDEEGLKRLRKCKIWKNNFEEAEVAPTNWNSHVVCLFGGNQESQFLAGRVYKVIHGSLYNLVEEDESKLIIRQTFSSLDDLNVNNPYSATFKEINILTAVAH